MVIARQHEEVANNVFTNLCTEKRYQWNKGFTGAQLVTSSG